MQHRAVNVYVGALPQVKLQSKVYPLRLMIMVNLRQIFNNHFYCQIGKKQFTMRVGLAVQPLRYVSVRLSISINLRGVLNSDAYCTCSHWTVDCRHGLLQLGDFMVIQLLRHHATDSYTNTNQYTKFLSENAQVVAGHGRSCEQQLRINQLFKQYKSLFIQL